MIRLYGYWRSSAAYRVRIALALKGVPYEPVEVNLVSGEQRDAAFRVRNPQGLVPALEIDGAVIGQSLAIIDYLEALYPDPPLVPRDPLARAQVLAQALVVAADIHPITNLRVLNRLADQFGADQPAKDEWYRHWIAEGFTALEQMAGDGLFLGGDAPNLADVCLVPQMYNARRFSLPLDAYPKLVAADAASQALPAIAAVAPERVKPG
ncbi:MAG: maleylacetoacetate isomerase [Pseudomonadota bacterium]